MTRLLKNWEKEEKRKKERQVKGEQTLSLKEGR
jgi:hypothetical protein